MAPAAIRADPGRRRQFQARLAAQGVPLCWFIDVGVEHPAFAALQMAAITGAITRIPDSLEAAALPGDVRRRYGL
jgi:hypothetical protein